VLHEVLAHAGVRGALQSSADAHDSPADARDEFLPPGLQAVRRGSLLFLLNHGEEPVSVAVPAGAVDLLTDERTGATVVVAPEDARVLSERRTA
jgi:beta-galactosidase